MATAWRFERNLGNPNSKKAVQEAKIAVGLCKSLTPAANIMLIY
jgi:hypothetical protein